MKTRWTASLLVLLAVAFFAAIAVAASPLDVPGPPGQRGRQMIDQGRHGPAEIPAGAAVTVRTDSQITIGTSRPGDVFRATLDEDIVADGKVLVRRGAPAEIRLMKVREDQDQLAFKLYTLTVHGKQIRVVSDTARERARRDAPPQQQPSLGGALGQAGAAALGGALGAPGSLTWSGAQQQDAKVPAGTFLEFTLREPVRIGR